MIRLLWFIPSWFIFMFLIRAPLILMGLVLVPFAASQKAYVPYEGHDGAGTPRIQYRWTWKWMWLWGNDEDGIADNTYHDITVLFWRIVYWAAIRNPANNLRYAPYLSVKIVPEKVRFIGNEDTYLCWQGFYSSFRCKYFFIGWKIYPKDVNGVTSHRKISAGFTSRIGAV